MIKLTVKPHHYYRRDGHDIHTDKYVTISEAILGSEVNIKTLYGDVKVRVDPGTTHNDSKKLVNYVSIVFSN